MNGWVPDAYEDSRVEGITRWLNRLCSGEYNVELKG